MRWTQKSNLLEEYLKTAKPLQTQVGGHKPSNEKKKMLKAGIYALKPLQTSNRGYREVAFYEAISIANDVANQIHHSHHRSKPHQRQWRDQTSIFVQSWLDMHMMMNLNPDEFDVILNECDSALLQQIMHEIELFQRLSHFVSPYFGVTNLRTKNNFLLKPSNICSNSIIKKWSTLLSQSYIIMDDLTHHYKYPCILDLKMGRETFEPDAKPQKIQKEKDKYPMQSNIGFRLVGMKICSNVNNVNTSKEIDDHVMKHSYNDYHMYTYNKHYGYSLDSKEKILNAFRNFFYGPFDSSSYINDLETTSCNNNSLQNELSSISMMQLKKMKQRRTIISNLLLTLRTIELWFQDNQSFSFYANSLLIAFEGDTSYTSSSTQSSNEQYDNQEKIANHERLFMIDFCHVRREQGGHHGYLYGITNLIDIWMEILNEMDVIINASLQ